MRWPTHIGVVLSGEHDGVLYMTHTLTWTVSLRSRVHMARRYKIRIKETLASGRELSSSSPWDTIEKKNVPGAVFERYNTEVRYHQCAECVTSAQKSLASDEGPRKGICKKVCAHNMDGLRKHGGNWHAS